jgi:hypothetical protein
MCRSLGLLVIALAPLTAVLVAHASQGCSADNLRATGGAGLLYCFAAN